MFFLPFSAVIMRGQRTVRVRSEFSLIVVPTGSARVFFIFSFLDVCHVHSKIITEKDDKREHVCVCCDCCFICASVSGKYSNFK